MPEARSLKLYWCEADDHHEDWFVVARRAGEALRFFRDREGYDDADILTRVVIVVPESLQNEADLGWPSRELLESCGAEIVRWETPRVVQLAGTRWVEGMLEHQILEVTDDLFEKKGEGRPNRTRRRDLPS